MQMGINDSKSQKLILIIALLLIAKGLYDLITGDYNSFFTGGSPQTSRASLTDAALFLVALVLAFYSARNLLRKKSA